MKSNLSEIFPWKYLVCILLVSILCSLLIKFINLDILVNFNSMLINNVLIIIIGGLLYIFAFISLCLISGLLNKNTILGYIRGDG